MKKNPANYHILIVEDEPLLSMNYSDSLKEHGYNISQAMTLLTARNILCSSHIDLLILDGDLPDGKGIDLIPFIKEPNSRSINNSIPIVYLSAYGTSNKEQVKINYSNEITKILQKPIAMGNLVDQVNQIVALIPRNNQFEDNCYIRFINNSERENLLNLAIYEQGQSNYEKN
ncbi:response regulator [Lentisphaerota bacterium WC36G]|nr:response regulator [Lentisphaerae bacterium WC36]